MVWIQRHEPQTIDKIWSCRRELVNGYGGGHWPLWRRGEMTPVSCTTTLAGLVAVCAGSDIMHPVGALATGTIAGLVFVSSLDNPKPWVDDVLGVWPLHGYAARGAVWPGIFGQSTFGGIGGVSLLHRPSGQCWNFLGPSGWYDRLRRLKVTVGLRLSAEEEYEGAS